MCKCVCHVLGEVCLFGPKDSDSVCCADAASINGALSPDGMTLWVRISDPLSVVYELRKGDGTLEILVENLSTLTNDSDVLAMMLPTEGMYGNDDECN